MSEERPGSTTRPSHLTRTHTQKYPRTHRRSQRAEVEKGLGGGSERERDEGGASQAECT